MRVRYAWIAALALLFSTAALAGPTVEMVDETPFSAPPDVVKFVLEIAGPTAKAPGGNATRARAVTLGRNASGEVVVTSIQSLADDAAPIFPAGTVAVMTVRHPGACQPPHGEADAAPLDKRIYSFFVDYRGDTIWELGYRGGMARFWPVTGPDTRGPEETYNLYPEKYHLYTCAKYE